MNSRVNAGRQDKKTLSQVWQETNRGINAAMRHKDFARAIERIGAFIQGSKFGDTSVGIKEKVIEQLTNVTEEAIAACKAASIHAPLLSVVENICSDPGRVGWFPSMMEKERELLRMVWDIRCGLGCKDEPYTASHHPFHYVQSERFRDSTALQK